MQTRSQTKMVEYNVDINFDEASIAWRANKVAKKDGGFAYICEGKTKLGKKCVRKPLAGCNYCKLHKNKLIFEPEMNVEQEMNVEPAMNVEQEMNVENDIIILSIIISLIMILIKILIIIIKIICNKYIL